MDLTSLMNSANPNVVIMVTAQDLKEWNDNTIRKTVKAMMAEYRGETYDASDVMKLLHVGRTTVANMQKSGKLKVVGVAGNKNLYDKKQVDELIEANLSKSNESNLLVKLRAERKAMLGQ